MNDGDPPYVEGEEEYEDIDQTLQDSR